MKNILLLIPLGLLVSCAGYRLGVSKPAAMAHVKTIAVPMFANDTLHPRAEALATSAVTNAMVLDGTYRIAKVEQADAVLTGTLKSIQYRAIRGSRLDSLHPEELSNTVTLDWTVTDARDRTKVLASGTSEGSSQLYVGENLQTVRNNALPDALERAATDLVSRVSNGF